MERDFSQDHEPRNRDGQPRPDGVARGGSESSSSPVPGLSRPIPPAAEPLSMASLHHCRYADYRVPAVNGQRRMKSPERQETRQPERANPRQRGLERGSEPRIIPERELKMLAEVGRFRVIRAPELREVFFNGNERSCTEALVRLRNEGLIEDRLVRRRARHSGSGPEKIRMISLTRAGKKLVKSRAIHDTSQSIYSGLVKEREALHDSQLYPVYRAHVQHLERQGATVRRVVLDFELKKNYLRELRKREKEAGATSNLATIKQEVADKFELPILEGKIQYPDLRIEYEMPDLSAAKADIELATASYHQRHIAQKARAGFTLYAAPGDRGRLGGTIFDDHDLSAEILSF